MTTPEIRSGHKRSTRVGIVGAGPAGLLMSHLLHRAGIDNVVLEQRDRQYTLDRIRAGVLEQGTVEFLTEAGLGDRLHSEGQKHHGIYLQYGEERHRVPFTDLIGRSVWVYGQQEVVKDLVAGLDAAGTPALYEATNVAVHDLESSRPSITYTHDGGEHRLECDVIVGADGFHGVCRPSIPSTHLTTYQRDYPFAWLGILANVAPSTDELIYALHEKGFAMHSMRSETVSRLYLQVDPTDSIENWSDQRIWEIQHFSTWMTRMLHRFSTTPGVTNEADEFDYQVQLGQLSQLVRSPNGMAHLSEYYTGLDMDLGDGVEG